MEHSHRYREPHAYVDRTVLVLGASASGLDISLELAKVAKTVTDKANLNARLII